MDPLIHTYTANSEVASADLNAIQQRADGAAPATSNNIYSTGGSPLLPNGRTTVEWMFNDGTISILDGALALVDDSIDWRDRVLVSLYCASAAVQSPGTSDDYLFDNAVTIRKGYTGRGALDAGASAPSAGNPPLPASGTSWAPTVTTNLYLYAHPSTGALYLYNDTGSTIVTPQLTITATAQTGWRP